MLRRMTRGLRRMTRERFRTTPERFRTTRLLRRTPRERFRTPRELFRMTRERFRMTRERLRMTRAEYPVAVIRTAAGGGPRKRAEKRGPTRRVGWVGRDGGSRTSDHSVPRFSRRA